MQRLLCVDDDSNVLLSIRSQAGHLFEIFTANTLADALKILGTENLDFILLDVSLGRENGIDILKKIKSLHPEVNVIMLSGERDLNIVVDAIREGALDFLSKPFDLKKLQAVLEVVKKNYKTQERYEALIESQNPKNLSSTLVTRHKPFRQMLHQAEQLCGHQANVLITGESGTGKELVARIIHRNEKDLLRPFIAVNCAAIPDNLIEAELFGAERGSYTGALSRRIGRFELADGGDIFLDEIGSLKLDLQAKLLRVLQEREFARLGGDATIKVNFRVISATNDSLEEKVARGEFRMDLYHRLRVIQFIIPPLRDRKEDIPLLVEHFLKKHAKGKLKYIAPKALDRLLEYRWPGNVRELENVVQSLIILTPTETVEFEHLPVWAFNGVGEQYDHRAQAKLPTMDQTMTTLKDYTFRAERLYIEHVLTTTGGDKSKAARLLDVGRTTLYSKLKEFELV